MRVRKAIAVGLMFVPGIAIILGDILRRHDTLYMFTGRETRIYVFWCLLSGALWGAVVHVAMLRRGAIRWWARALLFVGAALAVGGQAYIFARYQAYLDHRAALVGTTMLPSIGQQLWSDRWAFLAIIGPPLLFAMLVPLASRHVGRWKRNDALFALDVSTAAILLAMFGSVGDNQGAPPDVLYVSAMGQLARAHWDHNETVERIHPGPRSPIPVPALTAKPPMKRNVVFVITESVRAQSVCVAYDAHCKWTPFSNRVVPNRLPLLQMRALDSTTAISLAIMWSGHDPTESRKDLHSAPLLWEYLHAANLEGTYWTSQNLLFGNSGTWIASVPLTKHVSATQLEPDATMELGSDDGALVDYALHDMDGMHEPYLEVVHLSNTHFPYKIDARHSPFQPEAMAGGPGYENEIRNRYQDSIYLQDIAVGRLLEGIRARPEADRTIVVFVSDHGEQEREKGAVGHTGTVWDWEIRIPFWIDAPPGTLTPDEEASLESLRNTPVTSLDIFPTLLDLMGLWDAPELAELKKPMPGRSLLRGGSDPARVVKLTNCTELWACAFRNWGAMKGMKKLIAHQGDHAWGCYDTASDPEENVDLGTDACGVDLLEAAEGNGRGHPW
ncbi:hypothetical protein BH09MYX1_BH09MYX1_47350 [soil metagenome]